MKVTLSLKSKETGRFRVVRCECCKEPRKFSSWKKAKEFAIGLGHTSFRIKRV